MTVQEALNVLSQVCASVSANLETHKKMQEALQILSQATTPVGAVQKAE